MNLKKIPYKKIYLLKKIMEKKSLKIEKQDALEENVLRWESVQDRLKENLGAQIYSSWLKNIKLIKEYNHYVILGFKQDFSEIG